MFRFASKNLLEKKKLSKHKMEAGTSVMSSSEFISRIDFISKQDQKKKEELVDILSTLPKCSGSHSISHWGSKLN